MYCCSNTHSTKRHATSNLWIDIKVKQLFHHVTTHWISIASYIYGKQQIRAILSLLTIIHHKKETDQPIMNNLINIFSLCREERKKQWQNPNFPLPFIPLFVLKKSMLEQRWNIRTSLETTNIPHKKTKPCF
jgi:hypothetical protein